MLIYVLTIFIQFISIINFREWEIIACFLKYNIQLISNKIEI